jgi:F1F0 ATPase subunit 2
MMTTDIFMLLASVAGGSLLGLLFFGGLRWTLRKGLGSRLPALWFAGSFLIRSGLCVLGFYWIGAGDPLRLLACLAGFIVMRLVVVRLTTDAAFAPRCEAPDPDSKEARHAP